MIDIQGNNLVAERFGGVNNTAQNRDPVPRENTNTAATFAFSLSNAVISLEANIARSLEIHGAAPSQSTASLLSQNSQSAPEQRRSDFSGVPQNGISGREVNNGVQQNLSNITNVQANIGQQVNSQDGALQNVPDQLSQASATGSVLTNPAALAISSLANQRQNGLQNQSITQSGTRLDGQSATNRAQTLFTASDKAVSLRPPQANVTQESFARLISTRLANQNTQFDVRLDPPELGRVAIRFEAGEKASLNLAFEQQSTLDLFQRDSDALFALLRESGIDTGDEFQLSFEHAHRDQLEDEPSLNHSTLSNDDDHQNLTHPQPELVSTLTTLPDGLLYTNHPLLNNTQYSNGLSPSSLLDIQV